MLRAELDHLVIAARTLDEGAAYVAQALGVTPAPGGVHARMGTHNLLLHLGEQTYLEVIAVDPGTPPPQRPRWFQLDDPSVTGTPRLVAWVARTNDIHTAVAAAPVALGKVESMTRGALEWLITVPDDGRLILDGIAPVLIQWPDGVHPAPQLEDRGCRLARLRGLHARADTINALLAAIGLHGNVAIAPSAPGESAPRLEAEIRTPAGARMLAGT